MVTPRKKIFLFFLFLTLIFIYILNSFTFRNANETITAKYLKLKLQRMVHYAQTIPKATLTSETDFDIEAENDIKVSIALSEAISETEPYFLECLRKRIDWLQFKNELESTSSSSTSSMSMKRRFNDILSMFVKADPLAPSNDNCGPSPSQSKCEDYPGIFSGLLPKPARVGHMIQIGNDIDTLEIHLNEIADFTDRIFLIESIVSHQGKVPKSLQFESVKFTDRFSKFRSKIVHFIIDDSDIQFADEMMNEFYPEAGKIWTVEIFQELIRWIKFLEWNYHSNYFGPDDIIGFGDADEIASRDNMALLRNCKLQPSVGSIDIGVAMIVGSINNVFKSDYPVGNGNFPYSLGDPTFFRVSHALKSVDVPTRMKGKSAHFLLGGVHMTEYEYLPYLMLKRAFCTECGLNPGLIDHIHRSIENTSIVAELMYSLSIRSGFEGRFSDVSSVTDEISSYYSVPWFLKCNSERFPSWHDLDHLDSRLTDPKSAFSFQC